LKVLFDNEGGKMRTYYGDRAQDRLEYIKDIIRDMKLSLGYIDRKLYNFENKEEEKKLEEIIEDLDWVIYEFCEGLKNSRQDYA